MSDLPKIQISNVDKFVHFTMGGGLCGCIFLELTRYFKRKRSAKAIFYGPFILTCIYGGIIELIQHYFTNRVGDWLDFTFNGLGAATACFLVLFINSKIKSKA